MAANALPTTDVPVQAGQTASAGQPTGAEQALTGTRPALSAGSGASGPGAPVAGDLAMTGGPAWPAAKAGANARPPQEAGDPHTRPARIFPPSPGVVAGVVPAVLPGTLPGTTGSSPGEPVRAAATPTPPLAPNGAGAARRAPPASADPVADQNGASPVGAGTVLPVTIQAAAPTSVPQTEGTPAGGHLAGVTQPDAPQTDLIQTGVIQTGVTQAGLVQTGLQAGNEQAALAQAADLQAAPPQQAAHPAAPSAPAPAPSVANQILPGVVSMAQSHGPGGRLSVSMTPDELGHVSITVDRAADGTTSIHVAAERLTTLDLLRKDQGDLVRSLDQAGIAANDHSLSFSWDGGSGGMPGWGGRDAHAGDRRPGNVARSYVEEPTPLDTVAATSRGGVDITA